MLIFVTLVLDNSGVLAKLKSSHCAIAAFFLCGTASFDTSVSTLFKSNMAMLIEANAVEIIVINPNNDLISEACFSGEIKFNVSNSIYDP